MLCDAPSASMTFASPVNGGMITTSPSVLSPRSTNNIPMNRAASACVMFIFQWAATFFFLIKLFVGKRGDSGKFFPFEQFERRAAAGGNKRHFVGKAGLFPRGDRIAAADNRGRS